mgnify:CR=1 FL=1
MMNYPDFFNILPKITLQDSLADFLGTFEDGIVEFSYLDIVKSAGHSCPTVAGAYLLTLIALQKLYPNELPKRGEIEVFFKENQFEGVAGVIANVVTHITGATYKNGFKGISGKFDRTNLLFFNAPITSSIKFERKDTKQSIELIYDISEIATDPKIPYFMKQMIQGIATKEDQKLFGVLWQKRVHDIFVNIDKVILIV